MPITYGMNLAKSWGRYSTLERHSPDEGIHNPHGGIGGVRCRTSTPTNSLHAGLGQVDLDREGKTCIS